MLYENKPINNYKARESNVLSSFLAQFKENRTLPAMAQDRIIFLVSKTDQLAAITDADDHAQSVYKGVINAFQMRHGDIFKSISYSTGTWNDQGIPTSLNEKNAHRLANYLYQLIREYDLPLRDSDAWFGSLHLSVRRQVKKLIWPSLYFVTSKIRKMHGDWF